MTCRMAPVLVTLNDFEDHSPVAGLFKCNSSNICVAFYQISTESVIARCLSDSGLFVYILNFAKAIQNSFSSKLNYEFVVNEV